MNTSSCLESNITNANVEDERSEAEEEELNEGTGPVVPSVSAGSQSPSIQEPVVVSIKTEKPESMAEPVIPEVSLLDTNKSEWKSGEQQRRPSHGFVMGAATGTGDDETTLTVATAVGVEGAKEPEHGSAPPTSGVPVTGAKTYANLFKSGLTATTTVANAPQFSSRNPFPARPSGGSTTVSYNLFKIYFWTIKNLLVRFINFDF